MNGLFDPQAVRQQQLEEERRRRMQGLFQAQQAVQSSPDLAGRLAGLGSAVGQSLVGAFSDEPAASPAVQRAQKARDFLQESKFDLTSATGWKDAAKGLIDKGMVKEGQVALENALKIQQLEPKAKDIKYDVKQIREGTDYVTYKTEDGKLTDKISTSPIKEGVQTSESPFFKYLGKEQAEDFSVRKVAAQDAVKSLRAGANMSKLLDSGAITGTGANLRLGVAKALKTLGVIDAPTVENTEAYMAQAAKQVAEIIKAFGSGTGLSDADREYAQKAAAGEITMDADAMRRIMGMNAQASSHVIDIYNKDAAAIPKDVIPFDLMVEKPDFVGGNIHAPQWFLDQLNTAKEPTEGAPTGWSIRKK